MARSRSTSSRCTVFLRGHPFKTSALGGEGGSGHFGFFRTAGGGLAQDGRPVTFIFKDKVFIFSRTQLLNILEIQFEAFKFKECPASPFDKKNMTPVDHNEI